MRSAADLLAVRRFHLFRGAGALLISVAAIAPGACRQHRAGPATVAVGSTTNAAAGAEGSSDRQAVRDRVAARRAGQTTARVRGSDEESAAAVEAEYQKAEYEVPMRDGVRLHTAVYSPRDVSKKYPMLMARTPYSCRPYGDDAYRDSLGPNERFQEEGFIFVYQDVRGTFMSEGEFDNMRPHIPDKSAQQIDESTDTYDTIEWLLEHVESHNGKVGMWGISYPGFYAAAGMIDAHPALVAVSPQAPIADWYWDDFHHNGALFLPHTFNFFASFGKVRSGPTTQWNGRFDHGTEDGYQFFLDLGPLSNVETKYFRGEIPFWTQAAAHPDYDEFWQSRNILPHLHNVSPAVMTVGGWFDAEDLYGPLKIYQSVEEKNPDVYNVLVMGPWPHGGWGRRDGDRLGKAHFGGKTSLHFRTEIELPFFMCHLKGECGNSLPEATVFETGTNRWREFDDWPPRELASKSLYVREGGLLSFEPAAETGQPYVEYVSDPARPVPYTEAVAIGMTREYMTDDQRFASRRPDVAVWQTEPLTEPVTLAGPILADLWVSTSGTDSDWVVKVIDVLPPDAPNPPDSPDGWHAGGAQLMVRSEVMRGRYRNSFERPEPFVPDQATQVRFELLDVLHTFQPGHRIMVQIQSTWFPLVDRNPQKYVPNIYQATESDFQKAVQRVYQTAQHPSRLTVGLLE